ncbi:MAG: penicillin acylase family protein [Chthoniobacterales bacterium]
MSQYWNMMLARDLPEFIRANRRLQMPFFNVVYADRDGQIMYLFGGRQPRRSGGTTPSGVESFPAIAVLRYGTIL